MGSVRRRCISIIFPSSLIHRTLNDGALKTLCMPTPLSIPYSRAACALRGRYTWVSRASCTYIAPQVLNLTLMGEAAEHDTSGSNGTSNGAAFSLGGVGPASAGPNGDFDDLDTVHIEGGEEAISNGGPTLIARARRPSYSRLAAPSAVRTPSRPRSRRSTHDLAYGRARVEATSVSSSSVPSQRSNALPTQKSDEDLS
jgi:hypothetical protein